MFSLQKKENSVLLGYLVDWTPSPLAPVVMQSHDCYEGLEVLRSLADSLAQSRLTTEAQSSAVSRGSQDVQMLAHKMHVQLGRGILDSRATMDLTSLGIAPRMGHEAALNMPRTLTPESPYWGRQIWTIG